MTLRCPLRDVEEEDLLPCLPGGWSGVGWGWRRGRPMSILRGGGQGGGGALIRLCTAGRLPDGCSVGIWAWQWWGQSPAITERQLPPYRSRDGLHCCGGVAAAAAVVLQARRRSSMKVWHRAGRCWCTATPGRAAAAAWCAALRCAVPRQRLHPSLNCRAAPLMPSSCHQHDLAGIRPKTHPLAHPAHAWISRHVLQVLAWLMTRRRWELSKALQFLQGARPEAAPNAGCESRAAAAPNGAAAARAGGAGLTLLSVITLRCPAPNAAGRVVCCALHCAGSPSLAPCTSSPADLAALLSLEELLFGRQTVKLRRTKPEPRACPEVSGWGGGWEEQWGRCDGGCVSEMLLLPSPPSNTTTPLCHHRSAGSVWG